MADEPTLVRCPNCGKMNRVRPASSGVPHCGNCGATLPWLTESGEAEFPAVVEQSTVPVLVDFWAPWCGPCRIVSPVVEKIANDLPGRLKLVKVNSDDAPNLSRRFGIRGIPTLVLIDHGKEVARVTGALPAPALVLELSTGPSPPRPPRDLPTGVGDRRGRVASLEHVEEQPEGGRKQHHSHRDRDHQRCRVVSGAALAWMVKSGGTSAGH